ncbi:MAG: FAD-dependent oxidoreductase [Zhengella sp.]|uniref:NAD(P)/FAD-dependent oxidoreductase n=1 Tax=Zhengella sp. TaxID=2282762 RepID=UPI001E19674B|nr:FAD-dependent oxidoreductase [Notoacmeibacter sp.]MCC0028463.1 FAD-dependent oxidoreductase [Brucellaceae bacterium]
MTDRIIIVGAGHGGVQAAASLRQEGWQGEIAMISEDADLPYHKPPLSKAFLKAPDAGLQLLKGEGFYTDNAIDLMLGQTAMGIDRKAQTVTLDDGQVLSYTWLLLATGAGPRRLTCPGHDARGVFYLRNANDARALRDAKAHAQDIAVIGGGFIGLEAAATFAQAGRAVTVVEMADRLLGRAVSPEVSAHMKAYHESLGITVLTDTGLEAIAVEGSDVAGVRVAGGRVIPADIVIAGIGAMPETGLAVAAGLDTDNGIAVDGRLATSDPAIFAIGDCVSFPHAASGRRLRLESVQNATDQARHVAKTMLGAKEAFDAVAWFWSDQGERKLQMAGLSAGADRRLVSGDTDSGAFSVYHFAGDRLLAVDSVNRPGDHMLARRILAAGYSPGDAEIAAGAAALKAGLQAHHAA